MLLRVILMLTIMCAIGVREVNAQWRELQVTHFGPKEGISVRVNEVVQDMEGLLYLASTRGLIRYDGSNVTSFTHDPMDSTSIGPGEIYGIMSGSDSLIWLGLRYGGLNSFDPKTEKFRRFPVPDLPYFTIPTVDALFEDDAGNLWVGGHHFQLLQFDRETLQFTSYSPEWIDPEKYGRRLSIADIMQDNHNPDLLWLTVVDYRHPSDTIRGNYGLVTFDKRTKRFVSIENTGRVRHQDPDGIIWCDFLTNRVSKYDPATNVIEDVDIELTPKNLVRHLIPSGDGFWLAVAHKILSLDRTGEYTTLYEDASGAVEFHRMSRDRAGNLWIGSSPGITAVDPRKQYIRFFALDIFDAPQRIYPGRLAYHPKQDVVYLSHSAGPYDQRVYSIPLNPNDDNKPGFISTTFSVHGLAVDARGELLIAGDGGMYVLNGRRVENFGLNGTSEDDIPWHWNMRVHSEGWLGAAGHNEFIWFHPGERDVKRIEVADLERWGAVDDYQSEFVGFDFGQDDEVAYLASTVVYKVDLRTGEATLLSYDQAFNPDGQQLTDAIEDLHGDLWISGVNYLGKFRIEDDSLVEIDRFSARDGLASYEIHELYCDHANRIWLFTSSGINCINSRTREVRFFGLNEGLPEIAIDPRQVISTPDGRIITVNGNGIIVFHPDSLWESLSPRSVRIALKEIRINGVPIASEVVPNYIQQINVPGGRNVVDIQFQGLMYPTDEGMQYSYRLDTDNPWIDIGQNKLVTLPDLSPGDYTFQVKAGVAQSDAPVRSLSIHVPTPYYLQPWFIAIMILLIAAIIVLVYRYRVNTIRRQEEEKTVVNKRIAELELKALRSQMNPHFMFNSLNSIKDFILHSEPERAAEYLSDFAHLIRLILQNSSEKSITLKDELEALKLYIDLERLRFDYAFDFQCIVDDGVRMDDVQIPPMLLQPYIENAIWHGLMHKKEQGSLTLQFERENGKVKCTIDDDGIGRTRAKELRSMSARRYKSMGMGITQDRIEIMNRMDSLGIQVEIIDKQDTDGQAQGTRVILHIPSES